MKGKGIQRAKGEPGGYYALPQIEAPKRLTPTLPSPRTGAAWKE